MSETINAGDLTYELRISCCSIGQKHQVIDFLQNELNVDSFVEGFVDGLDLDYEYGLDDSKYFDELGGERAPLSIFKYDFGCLDSINASLMERFGKEGLGTEIISSKTTVWQNEWKKSFTPIETNSFLVFAPWDRDTIADGSGKIGVEIEPAMAFGTGQHATTLLCIKAIEEFGRPLSSKNLLDIGAGTGILSIAASKYGYTTVVATDIDPDAVVAMKRNAEANNVNIEILHGSVPNSLMLFDIIVANILFSVLVTLIPHIVSRLKTGGVVVMSGVLVEQTSELKEIAQKYALVQHKILEQDNWAVVVFRFQPNGYSNA